MKLEELRKRLQRYVEPKRAQKSTCGDSKPKTPPKIAPVTKLQATCAVCRVVQTVEVHRCRPNLMQEDENGDHTAVVLGEWWCVECEAHHLVKLWPK